MKTIAPAAMAAIEAGEAIVTGAVEITPFSGGTVIRLWGGYGPITFTTDTGDQTFQGLGNSAIAQQTAGAIGGVAQGLELGLSGVEPAALKLLDPGEAQDASVVLYRLIFASDGKTLLDAHLFDRGRGDTLNSEETIGGDATVKFAVESAARGLGRRGGRMRSDADQRLINANDGYFQYVDSAPSKMLYWGGKKPANAATALSGSSSPPGEM